MKKQQQLVPNIFAVTDAAQADQALAACLLCFERPPMPPKWICHRWTSECCPECRANF